MNKGLAANSDLVKVAQEKMRAEVDAHIKGDAVARWMRDPRVEDRLALDHVEWTYRVGVPLSEINEKASLENKARWKKLDMSVVTRYARSMMDGSTFPAGVAAVLPNCSLILLSGNHRYAATRRVGHRTMDLYVVGEVALDVRDRLIRSLNVIEGVSLSDEENLAHVKWLYDKYKTGIKILARDFGLTESRIEAYMRTKKVEGRFLEMDVDPRGVAASSVERLGAIPADSVFKAAASFVKEVKLPTDLVNDLVAEIRSVRDSDALKVIERWRLRPDVKKKKDIASSRGGLSEPPKAKNRRFFRLGSDLKRLLLQNPLPVAMQLTSQDELRAGKQVADEIVPLLRRFSAGCEMGLRGQDGRSSESTWTTGNITASPTSSESLSVLSPQK